MNPSIALLRHDNVKFLDQTIYFTGNAFFGCEFHKCTIIVKGLPYYYQNCKFNGCVWHIDVVLHDREQALGLQKFIGDSIAQSLPAIAGEKGEKGEKGESSMPPGFMDAINVNPT
jgi:hypothetical protein